LPKVFALDSILTQGKDYQTPERVGLVINSIGTNATTECNLVIDDKPTGAIREVVAPLYRRDTNTLPLLNLGALQYVIPPETGFKVEGPSGAKFRIKGTVQKLAPGEAMPAGLMARFAAQSNHYLQYFGATYSHGTDVKFVANAEVQIYSLTPKTIEKYVFGNIVEFSITNYTLAQEEIGIRFLLDDSPFDVIFEKTKSGPVDGLAMPRPPADTTTMEPFSLEVSPIEVLGDHTISIKARNIKGADISPAAGTSLTFVIEGITEFKRGS